MHARRLGMQGLEFPSAGRISPPVPEPDRSFLQAVRRGEVGLPEAKAVVGTAAARLLDLRQHESVPEQPDRACVDGWLHRSYLNHWHLNESPESLRFAAAREVV